MSLAAKLRQIFNTLKRNEYRW